MTLNIVSNRDFDFVSGDLVIFKSGFFLIFLNIPGFDQFFWPLKE